MVNQLQKAFLAEIESFLKRNCISASEFGKDAVNDRSFVRDLRAGRMPNLRIVDRVNKFMERHDSDEETAA